MGSEAADDGTGAGAGKGLGLTAAPLSVPATAPAPAPAPPLRASEEADGVITLGPPDVVAAAAAASASPTPLEDREAEASPPTDTAGAVIAVAVAVAAAVGDGDGPVATDDSAADSDSDGTAPMLPDAELRRAVNRGVSEATSPAADTAPAFAGLSARPGSKRCGMAAMELAEMSLEETRELGFRLAGVVAGDGDSLGLAEGPCTVIPPVLQAASPPGPAPGPSAASLLPAVAAVTGAGASCC
jgi:hypothetical protein